MINLLTAQFATNDEYDVLIRLGLTLNEARVFMALYSTENSTAKAIAKVSGVAREIVYQIIPRLQKKGLVDEQVTSPKTFKPIPFDDALDILLQQRKEDDKNLFAKAKAVAKRQQQNNNSHIKIDDSQITIIAPKKDDPKWKKDWASYKTTADLIMPTAKYLQWPQFALEATIDEAIQKKSKIRMITEKATQELLERPPIKYFTPSLAQKLKMIEYKFVDSTQVELVIFDKKVMYVSTQIEKQIKDMVWLRSNNGFLVQMANNYFDCLWASTPESKKVLAKDLPFLRSNQ